MFYIYFFLLVCFYAHSHPFFPPLNPHNRLEDICNAGNEDVFLEADDNNMMTMTSEEEELSSSPIATATNDNK